MRQSEQELVIALLGFDGLVGLEVVATRRLQYSTVSRLELKYSRRVKPTHPQRVFLKSSTVKEAKAEVDYYSNLAPAIGTPPLIECFAAEYLTAANRSYILLEDLTDTHSQPAQRSAPTDGEMRSAVRALAKAHAGWWNHPELGISVGRLFDHEWLGKFIDALNQDVTEFTKAAGGLLSAEDRKAYSLMLKSAEHIWGRLTVAEGLTATHGDTHWWNFLYPVRCPDDKARIFDWQLWHIDLGARDLAFLLALGGFAKPRPDLEASFLTDYHEEISANGIQKYRLDQLIEDYRWSAIRNLNIPVIFRSQGKHYTTWQTALRRSLDSFHRLGCRELIA